MNPRARSPLWILLFIISLLSINTGCGDDDQKTTTSSDTTAADTLSMTDVADTSSPPTGFLRSAPTQVFFSYASQGSPTRLYRVNSGVVGSAQADLVQISSGIDCSLGHCALTASQRYLIYTDNISATLRVAPANGGAFSSDDLVDIQTDVSDIRVSGDRVVFLSGGDYYALELDGELEAAKRFGRINQQDTDNTTYTTGGVGVGPYGDAVIVYRLNAGQLSGYRADLTSSLETPLFRLGVPNPHTSGGWFKNPIATTVAADGVTVAAVLEALDSRGICTDRSECAELGADADCHFARSRSNTESDVGICGIAKQMIITFKLDATDLGQACTDDSGCDPSHQCLFDGHTLLDTDPSMTCQPRRLVLAPVGSPFSLCDKRAEGEVTEVAPRLHFNNEGDLLFLTHTDCMALDISDDAVMAIGPTLDPSTLRVVEGRYGHDSGGGFCYNPDEDRWTYADCAIEIDDFTLKADGNSLVLLGSDPGSNNSGREIWLFDEADNKYPATNDPDFDAEYIRAGD